MASRHCKIKILFPFLSFLTHDVHTSGAISNITSTKARLNLIVTMSSYLSCFLMRAFWMLMIAKSLPSCVSMTQVSSTSYVATVVKLAYSFKIKFRCLFPPATVLPLIFLYIFSLRNIWDSKTYSFLLWVSSYWCLVSDVFQRWSCLIPEFIDSLDFFPCLFIPTLSESCIIIVDTIVGYSSNSQLKKCVRLDSMFFAFSFFPWLFHTLNFSWMEYKAAWFEPFI